MNTQIEKKVKKSEIQVARVYESTFQKEGTVTAEIKQTVTTETVYPSKRVTNSLQDNIFSNDEYGFEKSEPFINKETRVAWLDVPSGMSVADVATRLKDYPEAGLYRIMDNRPIISDNQQDAIDSKDRALTLDDIANSQAVRYPAGHVDAGKLALDNFGKVQYRRIAFSTTEHSDVDNRSAELDYGYMSPELKAEVNSSATVVKTQTL